MRIALVTHCEASHTIEKRVGGWFDSELTESGKRQAAGLPEKLNDLGFNLQDAKVYSSDLKRASQTAQLILDHTGRVPILDRRLREMSFGTHEGMSQQVHNSLIIPISPTGDRMNHSICNGAESRKEVAVRIIDFVNELMLNNEGDIVVVIHGFAATFFIAAFQKIDISSMGYINYRLTPGGVSVLETDELFRNRTVRLLNG